MSKLLETQQRLRDSRASYLEIARLLIGDTLYTDSLFFVSSIDHAIRLIDGLCIMLSVENITCARALLRLLMDACMRTYSVYIADDPDKVIEGFSKGKKFSDFLDDRGKKMSDGHLKDRMRELDRCFPEAYSKACGSVHFSAESLFIMAKAGEGECDIEMNIGGKTDERFIPLLNECGEYAVYVTHLHQRMLKGAI